MSYLSNNPFQRPTPNFSSNINTFNTYSGNDYVGMAGRGYGSSAGYGSSYGFGTGPSYGSTGGYFGASNKAESAEYKYARNVESNPFSTGINPFSSSTASPFSSSNVSTSNYNDKTSYSPYQPGNKYSRPSQSSYGSSLQNGNITTSYSRKEFSYEPRISNTSGLTDPYQESYFKNDKYDDRFRKSNFEMDFEIEIGKSRENQLDQKYKTGMKEAEISKMLYNSPFHRPNINSQTNKYAPTTIQNPYTSPHKKIDQYQSKDPYLTTSNVRPISGFGNTYELDQFNYTGKDNQIHSNTKNYQIEEFDFNNDRISQKDSRNTFINKFDGIISDKADSKENQNKYIQNQKGQQKELQNPFIRNSNPFLKSDKLSLKSSTNSHLENKKKTPEQDLKISASGGSSSEISLGDFQDIEKKKSLGQSVQQKYDKYIFRRSSDGSKKASNYEQKVEEKFDLWQKESSRKSQKYFDVQNIDREFEFDDFGRNSKKSLKDEKVTFKNNFTDSFGQKKDLASNIPMKQSLTQKMEMKQSYGNKNAFSFMNQSTQRSVKDQTEIHVEKNKKSLTEYDFNLKKNSKVFQFSGQNFTDEDQDGSNEIQSQFERNRRQIEDGLKKISQVSMSQQRESEPNFSKKPSQASLNQNNTEQKIDLKLEKYRYNYDKKPVIQQQPPKINDFIDIDVNDEEENGINYRQQSSFRQISPTQDEDQVLKNSRKRNNLKEKMINSSKKLIFQSHQIEKDVKNTVQQNPLNEIHHSLQAKIQTLKKQTKPESKASPQIYEFQGLQEFEQKYQYDMKGSGFDFDDDSFEETERKLGIEEDDNLTKSPSFNKVLSPEYGYRQDQEQKPFQKNIAQRDTLQPVAKNLIQPARSYISSISSNSQRPSNHNKVEQNQDFLPSFKMKDSLNLNKESQSEIRRSSHKPIVSDDAAPIMSSLRDSEKKKENIQQKVQKMKIYESQNQNQSFRSSGQYETYIYENNKGRQSSRKQSIKLFENEQKEEENVYKSPFEKKLQIIEPKRSSKIQVVQQTKIENDRKRINQYEYKSSQHQENKWGSQGILRQNEFNGKIEQENQEEEIYLSEEDLEETKKYNNSTLHKQNYMEEPVRDSFEFNGNKKLDEKNSKKQIKVSKSLKMQSKRKFPSTLELRGNIYHLIPFVQN